MEFQSKLSFHLIQYIEKNLSPLYKKSKYDKYNVIKEKNTDFRLNETNYIKILMRLDYFIHLFEEHSAKFNNKIWIQGAKSYFVKYFPNITNLFYERFILRNNIRGIEEGELDDDPGISNEDLCLYEIA